MPTPTKPVNVIRMEGKSHRTKRELKSRENAEKRLLTGEKLKERKEVKMIQWLTKSFCGSKIT